MITVAVYINGKAIFARSARNIGPDPKQPEWTQYKLDTGEIILHLRKHGALQLAGAMLDTIIEP